MKQFFSTFKKNKQRSPFHPDNAYKTIFPHFRNVKTLNPAFCWYSINYKCESLPWHPKSLWGPSWSWVAPSNWQIGQIDRNLACATDEPKLWLSPSAKRRQNSVLGPYLCTRIWVRALIGLLKKAIVDLPISMKGNSKLISGNSLSPLGAQNKDFGAVSQTFPTGG